MNRLFEVSYCETCKEYLLESYTSIHLAEGHNVIAIIYQVKEKNENGM